MRARREGGRSERGVVAVLSVFFVLMLLTGLAIAINVGRIMQTRGDLTHAADSAALAIAEGLNGDSAMEGTAGLDLANEYVSRFGLTTGSKPNTLVAGDVLYGHWHFASEPCLYGAGTCVGWEQSPDPGAPGYRALLVNAVRVTTAHTLPSVFDSMLSMGNVAMRATSTAVGRRSRVNCTLPIAIPTCRGVDPQTGQHSFFANGSLTCGTGFTTRLIFTSGGENIDPARVPMGLTIPAGYVAPNNSLAFGRIDAGNWRDQDWNGLMRDYVRRHTYDNQQTCLTEARGMNGDDTRDYASKEVSMPNAMAGQRPNLEPLIDGLLGVFAEGTLPTGPCQLGLPQVVALVDSPGGCGPSAWPATGTVKVIGYVNVVFTSIRCTNGTILSAGACGTAAQRQTCATFINDTMGNRTSGFAQVELQMGCGAPIGPSGGATTARQPRLVK